MSQSKISDVLVTLLSLLGKLRAAETPKLLEAARETGIPIGRILVMCRRLSEEELTSSLLAARAVLGEQMSTNKAALLLAYSFLHHIPFSKVEQNCALKKANTVALLLIASGFVDTNKIIEFDASDARQERVGGRDLFNRGLISLDKWEETIALALQVKRRELSVGEVLCSPDSGETTVVMTVSRRPLEADTSPIRLGHLLRQAGLVALEDLLSSLERGLESDEPLGQILAVANIITNYELTFALRLQSMIKEKAISQEQAVRSLGFLLGRRAQLKTLAA